MHTKKEKGTREKGKGKGQVGGMDHQRHDVALRPMRGGDIDAGLRLCRLAGWDQVRRDWQRFLEGPDSSTVAAVDRDDVVATSATIRYGPRFGWIGMVLVHPDA